MLIPVGINSWAMRSIAQPTNAKRLVVILLRGGIDGLNIVIPHQEANYYQARPTIAIPYPQEKNGAIDLNGFFGLHPALKDLMPWWKRGNLAFINGSGLSTVSRSHFDAQDYVESGTPGIKSTSDGWMNRLLGELPQERLTQALNVGKTTARILQGKMSVANLDPGQNSIRPIAIDTPRVNSAFSSLYGGDDALSKAYQAGNQARSIIMNELNQEMASASRGAKSADIFVDDAAEVAKLMVGDTKTQLAFMNVGGWDSHINEINLLNRFLPPLGEGLATLAQGLESIWSDTVIMVMSEFGRTVQENGNAGTDHGRGNVIWLLGGAIRGGQIYGQWEGLNESELEEGRDLPVTTDFREAIASILQQHLSLDRGNLASIFPEYQLQGNLNLLA
ncbi:MAG: DUF1501 domain-containing protein [Pleurocapsa sp.]